MAKREMMKNTIWLLLLLFGLLACNDNEEGGFEIPVSFRKDLSFRPVPGGAVMKYYLPRNTDILGVRVRYKDVRGEEVLKNGSYLSDSLILLGFNEKQKNVPAKVSFFNNNMEESEPIQVFFDTEDSAPTAFFDNLVVNSFWGGFSLVYTSPETVSGMVHIFYIGTNPLTQQLDTILVMSTPIVEHGDTLNFVLKQVRESNTVVVRTEDYRGYRVKQKIFDGLPALNMELLPPSEFDFKFTGTVQENEEYEIGQRYLFDQDCKGKRYAKNKEGGSRYKYATFVAGPNAFGERFIVDLRKEKIPAAIRLHAFLNYETTWPGVDPRLPNKYPAYLGELWSFSYKSRLPCKIKLYGTNENPETVDLNSCAPLFKLDGSPSQNSWQNSWAKSTDDQTNKTGVSLKNASEDEIDEAEACYLEMLCNYSGDAFRYLIFVVEDTFDSANWGGREVNLREFVSFNELEVFVKAE